MASSDLWSPAGEGHSDQTSTAGVFWRLTAIFVGVSVGVFAVAGMAAWVFLTFCPNWLRDFVVEQPLTAGAVVVGVFLAGAVARLGRLEQVNRRKLRKDRLRNENRLQAAEDRGFEVACAACRDTRRENALLRMQIEILVRKNAQPQ